MNQIKFQCNENQSYFAISLKGKSRNLLAMIRKLRDFRYIFLISKLIFKKISELMLIYLEDAYAA